MSLLINIAQRIKYRQLGVVLVHRYTSSIETSYYVLNRTKGKIDITFKQECISSPENLPAFSKSIPHILCMQGIGVVHRIIDGQISDLKQNIPNINIDEYYTERQYLSEQYNLAVLFRKEQLIELIHSDSYSMFSFIDVKLGFSAIKNYIHLFEENTTHFVSGLTSLSFSNGIITGIEKVSSFSMQEQYRFGGETYTANEILALCCGLNYFTSQSIVLSPELDLLTNEIESFTAQRIVSWIFKYGGIGLFFLLVINFLWFSNLNAQLDKLGYEAQSRAQLMQTLTDLDTDLKVKKDFVASNNILQDYAFAFFADRISSLASGEIQFSELSVSPVIGKIKNDKPIEFAGGTLHLLGVSKNSSAFSSFLDKIKQASWVDEIKKQVYQYNNERNNAEFEMEIVLSNVVD